MPSNLIFLINLEEAMNLITNLHQAGKIHNFYRVCGISSCVVDLCLVNEYKEQKMNLCVSQTDLKYDVD